MLYLEQLKKLEMIVQQKRTLRIDGIIIPNICAMTTKNKSIDKLFPIALEGRMKPIELKF